MDFKRRILSLAFISLLSSPAIAGTNYLSQDINMDCSANSPTGERYRDNPDLKDQRVRVWAIDPNTKHTTYMREGDTLWVSGVTSVEYQPLSYVYSKELIETYLMCGHNSQPTTNLGDYSKVQSTSGVNHWKIQGEGSRVNTTHNVRAMYTAKQEGSHTCWMIYSCAPKSGDPVVFKKSNSYLKYYSVNQYPGINWKPEGDHLVNSTATHTPAGSKIWDAGASTKSDTEVVVNWLPRLTNCESGDSQCGPNFDGWNADTYFDWRIVVYQYNGNEVCNKDFGSWNKKKILKHHDHHSDFSFYSDSFPIVTGNGSQGYCGTNMAHRKFKVYTQIRKTYDHLSDVMVHNSHTGRSNYMIYSR